MTNGFANCSTNSQCLVGICHEQSNPEFSDCACKEGSVERERRGDSCASFFPYLMYFCLHNYMNNSRNRIGRFRYLEYDNFVLPFQVSQMVVGG